MAAQDFAGRGVPDIVQAFVSGKAAARDIIEGTLDRCARRNRSIPSPRWMPLACAQRPMRWTASTRPAAR